MKWVKIGFAVLAALGLLDLFAVLAIYKIPGALDIDEPYEGPM